MFSEHETDDEMDIRWWRLPVINRPQWSAKGSHLRLGEWWRHAVIYQIFPQSFQDTSGNGVGDLTGIVRRLDYIRSLGVEAIWLNPIFPSTHEDAGYDVLKHTDVDPMFGDLEDFKRLLAVAHDLGMKVIIDQVWNHTSSAHPWFVESRSNRHNAKADWYVWADPNPNGGPPNNWISAFSGRSAWCWDDSREQYYLANFMPSQPDLNWHNEAVIDAQLHKARIWLEMGVDGFRIDAVNFFVHDPALRDNPPRQPRHGEPDGIDMGNPMASQLFTNSFCRDETLAKLPRIRALMDEFPNTVTLGEVTLCEDSIELSGRYVTGDDRLHLVYNSALLQEAPLTADMLRQIMEKTLAAFPDGGQCWMVGNHDYQRLSSRWTGADANGEPYPPSFYHMVAALLVALPGALCLFQGDELGLPLAEIPEDIPPDAMQDPYGRNLYPKVPGRDGSRTPMPWARDQVNLGFSAAEKLWLPIPKRHHRYTVEEQNGTPQSLLNTWRRMLQWRAAQPALVAGEYEPLAGNQALFVFQRRYAEQRLICIFNISPREQTYSVEHPTGPHRVGWLSVNQEAPERLPERICMVPWGAVFISVIEA